MACAYQAITLVGKLAVVDPECCDGCGLCVGLCGQRDIVISDEVRLGGDSRKMMETKLRGTGQVVVIGRHRPTVVIGERINPTGKRRLAEALASEDMSPLQEMARVQVDAGASVIDVNVGGPDLDEVRLLPLAVQAVAEAVEVPICIDSSKPAALAAALRVCPGRPLVNSVTGEEPSLAAVLPLVKESGATVIGMTMNRGVPSEPDQRLAIASEIVGRAEEYGISREDVIIDPMALSVGADQQAALVTLESIRLIKQELGVNIALGASNVSFGLPDRLAINQVFLAMAIAVGVTCPIADPAVVHRAVLVSDLLLGRDEHAARYLADYRARR